MPLTNSGTLFLLGTATNTGISNAVINNLVLTSGGPSNTSDDLMHILTVAFNISGSSQTGSMQDFYGYPNGKLVSPTVSIVTSSNATRVTCTTSDSDTGLMFDIFRTRPSTYPNTVDYLGTTTSISSSGVWTDVSVQNITSIGYINTSVLYRVQARSTIQYNWVSLMHSAVVFAWTNNN